MVRTERDRAYTPSALGDNFRIKEFTPIKSNKKYKFSKRINRLQWEDQIEYHIKPLFGEEYRPKGNQHYGKITITKEIKRNGKIEYVEKKINVRIDFSIHHPSYVSVEEKEDLEAAHRKVLDALSGR